MSTYSPELVGVSIKGVDCFHPGVKMLFLISKNTSLIILFIFLDFFGKGVEFLFPFPNAIKKLFDIAFFRLYNCGNEEVF